MTIAEVDNLTRVTGGSFVFQELTPNEIFTPEDFSPEQKQIAEVTSSFAEQRVRPQIPEIEAKNFAVSRQLMREAGELGLLGIDVPEEYGGLEMDKVTSALVADRMSVCGSFNTIFGADVEADDGRVDCGLCAFGSFSGFRRDEHPHPGEAIGRRLTLHLERREDVDFKCRLC